MNLYQGSAMNPSRTVRQLEILTCILWHSKTQSLCKNGHWKMPGWYMLLSIFVVWLHVLVMSRTRFRVNPTLYSCLNVKELLTWSRRKIWSFSDCNWTRTQNHFLRKRTLNHLAKWLSVRLWTKWFWVRVKL